MELEELMGGIKQLTASVEALSGQVAVLEAKVTGISAQAAGAARNNVSPALAKLLAKGGLIVPAFGKLAVDQVDKALESAGVQGVRAMETKNKLRARGVLAPT